MGIFLNALYRGGGIENNYIAGVSYPSIKNCFLENLFKQIYQDFSDEEKKKLVIAGGLLCMNLKQLRKDNMELKMIKCLEQNLHRLKQAEQDVLNLVLYPKIKFLPTNYMVCTYHYDIVKTKSHLSSDEIWLKEAIENPIQIHYAGSTKPWNDPSCTKSDIWFAYLTKTTFFSDLIKKVIEPKLFDCKFYLFNKIEILKIKNNKARLFGFIPISIKRKKQ